MLRVGRENGNIGCVESIAVLGVLLFTITAFVIVSALRWAFFPVRHGLVVTWLVVVATLAALLVYNMLAHPVLMIRHEGPDVSGLGLVAFLFIYWIPIPLAAVLAFHPTEWRFTREVKVALVLDAVFVAWLFFPTLEDRVQYRYRSQGVAVEVADGVLTRIRYGGGAKVALGELLHRPETARVVSLRIENTDVSESDLRAIGNIASLETLSFVECGFSDQDATTLAMSANFLQLSLLEVQGGELSSRGLENLIRKIDVRRLIVLRCPIDDSAVAALVEYVPNVATIEVAGLSNEAVNLIRKQRPDLSVNLR